MESGVYVLHFDRRICAEDYAVDPVTGKGSGHTTQHYLGSAEDIDARIARHREGRGARLTAVAKERGIGFQVVRTFTTDTPHDARILERELKRMKNTPRLCPVCRPESVDAFIAEHPNYGRTVN